MKDDILERLSNFAKCLENTTDEVYPIEELSIMEQDEIPNVQGDGAEPLDQLDDSQPIDDQMNVDSLQHSKDDSPYSPTKHQDEIGVGVLEVEKWDEFNIVQRFPEVFLGASINKDATKKIAPVTNWKSRDSWGSCFTSLSERSNNNKLQEGQGVATYGNFDLEVDYDEGSLEVQKLLMQHFEKSKEQGDVAKPLDKKLSDDSPTRHQDKLNRGICEEVVQSVDSAQISPNLSDNGIRNTATDPVAFEDNSKSYDWSHKSLTSLSKRPKIDPTNASKEDLPNNGPAEGTEQTNVQEPTGSSAVDGNGGGEVAVNEVDRMLQAKEDRKCYSVFDWTDYKLCGEILYCRICEKNVYSINSNHMKSLAHEQRLIEALNSQTKRDELRQTGGWQITADGLLRCNLCQKDYMIRTRHCFSEAHVLSKKYKTCPRIQALKLRADELWKKLPMTIFDKLLTLRLVHVKGVSAEASFCVGCGVHFNTHADRQRHERECEFHHSIVARTKKYSEPFSYSFGILPQARIERGQPLSHLFGILPRARIERGDSFRYCFLCKTGMTNVIEVDNHVHGADSQHPMRVRVFWTKVIPGLLESGLADAFPPPVRDTALYSLDMPSQRRLYYFENLLHVIVISTDGYSMCSLCDEYVCDRLMKKHCDSDMHTYRNKLFLKSLRNPNRRAWGFIEKEDVLYCVLCHIGFSNKFEIEMHLNSVKPHWERVELVNKFFDRFIKSAVHSSNSI